MKFHTFGFGEGCDKELVEKVAERGRGSSSLIGDDKSHLVGGKIILALEKAFEPSFKNCKYKYSHGGTTITKPLGEVHRNELIYKTLFVPEEELETFKFEFEYQDENENVGKLTFTIDDLVKVEGESQSEALYKMAAQAEILGLTTSK